MDLGSIPIPSSTYEGLTQVTFHILNFLKSEPVLDAVDLLIIGCYILWLLIALYRIFRPRFNQKNKLNRRQIKDLKDEIECESKRKL